MSNNGIDYEKKYLFKTDKKFIEDFLKQCHFKQHSNLSYFVKNKVVTLPIENGRKTLFNSKYISKIDGNKSEIQIDNKKEEQNILEKEFNIRIKTYTNNSYK